MGDADKDAAIWDTRWADLNADWESDLIKGSLMGDRAVRIDSLEKSILKLPGRGQSNTWRSEFCDIWTAALGPPSGSQNANVSSAAAVKSYEKWLGAISSKGKKAELTKDRYKELALTLIDGLTQTQFNKIWNEIVPNKWVPAGRPSVNKQKGMDEIQQRLMREYEGDERVSAP
ncbi:MAG: hypothetical protein O3A84_12605 [Proteobacteria bacterium]|nr:hypothetical protein [Pseudomonadota bacterium]